ncbi:MAG: TrkH family potassium uptake protein [Clostridiales bacterium]|nr:TrkH family potassium uptake protein [Clostridiales bacterium]
MNFRLILNIMGYTLWVEAGCLLLPLLVSAGYGEACWEPFLWTLGLCSLCGLILTRIPARKNRLQGRDGYAVVAMAWIVLCLFGAVPYVLSGAVPHYADALFETASGLTTTGATILTDVEAMPRGILFWRALTQWMGGMGVLVLATAILPSLGVPSHYLTQAESPGPVFSKLVPKQSQTSKILYTIYFAMTSLEVVLLKLAGMPLYDAFIHAFSTAGTGGFSNRNASVGAYGSPVIDMIIAVFALLFSVNFSVYFLVLQRRLKEALKSDELRFFLGVVAAATVVITLDLLPIYQNTLESLRYAFFQVASIISTTGFATADYVLWPQLSRLVLVLLMFCGACAGSTGGGIKCSRVLMLLRAIRREIHQIAHPRSVEVVKLDGKVAEESTVHSVLVFVGCYGLILLGAALVVSLDKMPFDVSFSAALTCLSNVGPGLAAIGPTGNFSGFSDLSKLALSLCMIVGRLEIFPILVMFSARTWRRD